MIRSIIACLLFAISLSATVINVPADHATIQGGIDAAVDGDTVLVQPGTYVENINFNGKNIVLGSLFLTTQDTSYISSTIIDGNQNGSVVMINSGESSMAMLAGFTIQNGTGTPYPDSEIFRGSGLFLENSSPVVDHCIIQNNEGHSGIGAFVHLGQPTFTNCAFQGNTNIGNQNNGQNECVIFNGWTASEYIDCFITSNLALGFYSYGSWSRLEGVAFVGNINGACFVDGADIIECNFSDNIGYGISVNNGGLQKCLITDNTGYGIQTNGNLFIDNCTITNNGTYGIYSYHTDVQVSESIITSNADGPILIDGEPQISYSYVLSADSLFPGVGNRYCSPNFVSSMEQDYRLRANSPCINSGYPDSVDSDGSRADIGALPYLNEYSGPNWYVTVDGDDIAGTGELSNAFASIQAGINFAGNGDSVLVSSGTYFENIDLRKNAITVIGVQGPGLTTIDGGENGTVVYVNHQNAADTGLTTLEGFTITNGNGYDNEWGGKSGGGIYCYYANPTLRNLIIENNYIPTIPTNQGGGIYFSRSSSLLENVIIRNNASYQGGGIAFSNGSGQILKNVVIENNTVTANGGAAFFSSTYNGSATEPIFLNCTITDNRSTAFYTSQSESTGGLHFVNGGFATLLNSILWGNTPSQVGVYSAPASSKITLQNSDIEDGQSGIFVDESSEFDWLSGNIDAPPQFVSNDITDYLLSDYSPCIGAGLDSSIVPISDIDGNPRPNPSGSNPDLGAYESSLAAPLHNSFIHVSTTGDDIGSVGLDSAPFATIQAAIDFSISGDTVLVQPGIYVENINFNGKNISVGSLFLITQDTSYIAQTVIDGNQNGSVVSINSGEDTTAMLNGLTLRNGSGTLELQGETWVPNGGGVYIIDSSPTLEHCRVIDNYCWQGSGIYFRGSSTIIRNCFFTGNTWSEPINSQVLCPQWSNISVYSSAIVNNNCGAISFYAGDGYFENLEVSNNLTGGDFVGSVNITKSVFKNNSAGVLIMSGTLSSTIISNNQNYGLRLNGSNIEINSCSIVGNSGHGVRNEDATTMDMRNSIVYSNQLGSIYEHNTPTTTISYSNIEGMWSGQGVIDVHPHFVDPESEDYRLQASSQCINAGHPDSTDSDGTRSDMGAYPYLNNYSGPDWHVSLDGDNISGSGAEGNPFASIQAGINFSNTGDSVSVYAGTYIENINFLGKAIKVKGIEGRENTIIDGSQSGSVVTFNTGENENSELTGFTISNGLGYCGGIYCNNVSPRLSDLIVENNTATTEGGGIYVENYSNVELDNIIVRNNLSPWGAGIAFNNSSGSIANCWVTLNNSTGRGGGIDLNGSSPQISNTLVTNNTAVSGSALSMYFCESTISHSTIVNNQSTGGGGAIRIKDSNGPTFLNSILWNENLDEITFEGLDWASSVTFTHSDVEGGLDAVNTSNPELTTVSWLEGNITSDPRFNDPDGQNYSLSDYSACLGAGTDTTLAPAFDIGGNPRPNPAGSNPDIGAYESPLAEPIVVVEVQNLHIGGSEETLHLTSHNPQITYSYYNSLEEPLGFHQIQVSSLSDFSLIDKWDTYTVINPDTMVTYAGNALVDGETYYLRVKAGSGDIWIDWVTLSFRMNSIPEAPALVSPIANTVIGEDLLFTVDNSLDLEEDELLYQFFLFEDVAMTALVDSSGLVPEGVDQTMWLSDAELLDNNQYWWTSHVFDGYEYSSLSAPASFLVNTENAAPETFELLFPTPEIVISSLTPTFSWHSALDIDPDDEVSYALHLDTPEPGVLIFELGSDTLFFPPEPLVDNTVYYWRVVAKDLLGFETESLGGYRSFVVNVSNDNPSVVNLITPDSVMVLSLTPEMFWTRATDVDPGDMVTYEMHWWGDGIEYDSVLTDTNAVVIPRELQDNKQYFWEVIAMDQTDGISHSQPATFWTDLVPEAPESFALLSPENDAAGLPDMPSFQWEIAEDPDPMDYATYTLQIASDSSFSNVVVETNTNVEAGLELTESLPTDTEYWWRVVATDSDSLTTESEIFKFTVGYVSIAEEIALPTEFVLDQNYPNPFNPSTTIRYGLPEEANVSLVIYDVRGQLVQTIWSDHQQAGWYDVVWNGETAGGKTISTGIYFARLVAGEHSQVVKMLYLK